LSAGDAASRQMKRKKAQIYKTLRQASDCLLLRAISQVVKYQKLPLKAYYSVHFFQVPQRSVRQSSTSFLVELKNDPSLPSPGFCIRKVAKTDLLKSNRLMQSSIVHHENVTVRVRDKSKC
jgi:hypothetical protein